MTRNTRHARSSRLLANAGRARALAAVVGLAASFAPELAAASCLAPGPELLWSYPGNGSVDVPTDADLFFTGDVFGVPSVGNTPLERLSNRAYDLGELEPRTTYEVRWSTAVIAFTTGDGPNHRAPAPTEELVLTRNPPLDGFNCPLVESQGCFDTGPPTVVALEDQTAKLASLIDVLSCDGSVQSLVWPAECGAPMIASYDGIVCVRSRTTLGAGLGEPTDYVCSVPAGELAAIPRSSSCVGAWPPAGVRTVRAVATDTPSGEDDAAIPADDASPTADEAVGCALAPSRLRRDGSSSLLAAFAIGGVLLRRTAQRRRRAAASGSDSAERPGVGSRPGFGREICAAEVPSDVL